MPMQVLVTGAAGQLGSEVCKALLEAGHAVRATDAVFRKGLPALLDVADLLDYCAAYRLMEGCDAVAHLANHASMGMRRPGQLLYSENVTMDVNVFQSAADLGVKRILFASSVQALGGSRTGDNPPETPSCLKYLPIDGDAPACPGSLYALSKEAGEQQLKFYAARDPELSATAVRFPSLWGQRHVEWIRRARGERPDRPHGFLDEGFAYLHISDGASLVVAVIEKQRPGYHQLFPAAPAPYLSMPIPEIVRQFYPGVPLRVPIEEMKCLVDTSAIEKTLGWKPKNAGLFAEP